MLKRLYRWPMDYLEEKTTGQADLILVNSEFTCKHFSLKILILFKRKNYFLKLYNNYKIIIYDFLDGKKSNLYNYLE